MGKERVPDINILLVGPTGVGKSTTGNALLGEEVFTTGDGFDSVTREINFGDFELPKTDGSGLSWWARVIDSPGHADTSLSAEEHQELFDPFADQASEGLHVLLFFVYGRLDPQTQQVARLISERMGDDIKRITILVVTHSGKHLQKKELALKESVAFQKWQDHFQGGLVCIEHGDENENQAHVKQVLFERLAAFVEKQESMGEGPWSNESLAEAKAWRQAAEQRIAQLPANLQPGPRTQVHLLQRGQATRTQVTHAIEEQEAIHRAQEEMTRKRLEAERALVVEERQKLAAQTRRDQAQQAEASARAVARLARINELQAQQAADTAKKDQEKAAEQCRLAAAAALEAKNAQSTVQSSMRTDFEKRIEKLPGYLQTEPKTKLQQLKLGQCSIAEVSKSLQKQETAHISSKQAEVDAAKKAKDDAENARARSSSRRRRKEEEEDKKSDEEFRQSGKMHGAIVCGNAGISAGAIIGEVLGGPLGGVVAATVLGAIGAGIGHETS